MRAMWLLQYPKAISNGTTVVKLLFEEQSEMFTFITKEKLFECSILLIPQFSNLTIPEKRQ